MRVLIDTNVFVGACLGQGPSATVLQYIFEQRVQPLMGAALFAEYEDVLSRQELFLQSRLNINQREELLDIFLSYCQWVTPYYLWCPNLRDEGDNHIVELAIAGNAKSVITWNVRDFSRMELRFSQIDFLTPTQWLPIYR